MKFLLLILALLPLRAFAITAEISAARDNTLYETTSAVSNGQGDHLFAGLTAAVGTADPFLRRAVMYFDVSGLPAQAQVESVTMRLHLNRVAGSGPSEADYTLHRALVDWGEGSSNASGNEGTGAAAAEGDATWTDAFYSATTPIAWTQPGGDFDPVASGSITTELADELYFFTSTSALVSDVQSWIDQPTQNYGWFLLGEEGVVGSARRFTSSNNNDQGPVLSVTYSVVPEPASGILLLVGLGMIWPFRGQTSSLR